MLLRRVVPTVRLKRHQCQTTLSAYLGLHSSLCDVNTFSALISSLTSSVEFKPKSNFYLGYVSFMNDGASYRILETFLCQKSSFLFFFFSLFIAYERLQGAWINVGGNGKKLSLGHLVLARVLRLIFRTPKSSYIFETFQMQSR